MSLEIVIAIVAVSLVVQGFFAGSEIALVSCDKIKLKSLADGGSQSAKLVMNAFSEIERFISTTLVGINLALITSTVVMTLYFEKEYGKGSELYAVLILSPLIVIFGQIVPKAVFQRRRDTAILWAIYPLIVASWILYPVLAVVNVFTKKILTLIGSTKSVFVTREELIGVIEGDTSVPRIDYKDRMIKRIFRFSETTVAEIMIPLINVSALSEDAAVRDAICMINETGHTRIPIYSSRVDNITGMLHSFYLLGENPDEKVRSFARPPYYVPESKFVDELLDEMKEGIAGLAVVVDEYGGAVGIIALEDILEEVVGEIEDEYDKGARLWRKTGENEYLVNPKIEIDVINDELALGIPESDDYETLGGFLLMESGTIPRPGDKIRHGGWQFTVTKATSRSIDEVRVVQKKKK
ncbi:MAG: HlyC/CorC family transporter [Candidatus Dadabacteria bacterium]|nr:HlyC/CorC family transporter [Candidatus Dadabacteria bacterium]